MFGQWGPLLCSSLDLGRDRGIGMRPGAQAELPGALVQRGSVLEGAGQSFPASLAATVVTADPAHRPGL